MKKVFKLVVETDTGFPEDLYGAEDFQESIQEHLDNLNWVFRDTPKCTATVEELPVASLGYLQSQPGINPEYKDAILAMEKKVWENGGL